MAIGMTPSLLVEQALLDVDLAALRTAVAQAQAKDASVGVLEELFTPAMERIGVAWEKGELALAQVYMASRLVERIVDEHLAADDRPLRTHPPVAMAVLDDHHVLGKRLVLASARMAGWTVADWGAAQDPVALAQRAREEGLAILLISTLMDRSARRVALVTQTLHGLGATTRVIVGGAPFRLDPELWRLVGADATAGMASEVASLLSRWTGAP